MVISLFGIIYMAKDNSNSLFVISEKWIKGWARGNTDKKNRVILIKE